MRSVKLILCVGLMLSSTAYAATYQTIANGDFNNPSIWDCGCIPGIADDVIISHSVKSNVKNNLRSVTIDPSGRVTVRANKFRSIRAFTLKSGGVIDVKPGAEFECRQDVVINGEISGYGKILFNALYGPCSIDGVPNWTFIGPIEFKIGTYVLEPGSTMDFDAPNLIMRTDAIIQNWGEMILDRIVATGFSYIQNRAGATLTVINNISSSVKIDADHGPNDVIFEKNGASTQFVYEPSTSYHNLTLRGNTLSSVKRLRSDISIVGELSIENSSLDVRNGSLDYNIEIEGDWNNISGRFVPRTGMVDFNGPSQSLFSHTGTENFNDLDCSGTLGLLSDISAVDLTIGGNLQAQGFDIWLEGDWANSGSFVANGGTVIFNDATDSNVSGNTEFEHLTISKTGSAVVNLVSGQTGVFGTLLLDAGVINTNDNLYIRSTEDVTGRIGEVTGGSISGDVTVERYMNFPDNGWRLIGAPMAGATLGTWNNDFITTGFAGSDWPTYYFNSITRYDETVAGDKDLGVIEAGSMSDPIQDGEGVRAYIASGYNLLTAKGTMHTGPFSWGITYTDSGSPDDDGWNLISNPYASTIDWDDNANWTKSNVKDAIYVWTSEYGQFSSYIAGIGTNGGTQYIPSSQAFWIQTDGTSPVLSIDEGAKTAVDAEYRSSDENQEFFKLILTDVAEQRDEAAVRFAADATRSFDSQWDAYEFRSEFPSFPSMGLIGEDGVNSSIYSLAPISEQTMIPLSIHIGYSGSMEIKTRDLSSVSGLSQVSVYDAVEGSYHGISDAVGFQITLPEGDYEERFYLVLEPGQENIGFDKRGRTSGISDDLCTAYVQDDHLVIRTDEDMVVDLRIVNHLGQVLMTGYDIYVPGIMRRDISTIKGPFILQVSVRGTGQQQSFHLSVGG